MHMWPLSTFVDQIDDPTHLAIVRLHRENQCLEHAMRGVVRLIFVAFFFSLLLLFYQHQSWPNLECGAGEVSREVSPSFDLPDNVTLASLNTTGRAEVDILFFNRVPKVT